MARRSSISRARPSTWASSRRNWLSSGVNTPSASPCSLPRSTVTGVRSSWAMAAFQNAYSLVMRFSWSGSALKSSASAAVRSGHRAWSFAPLASLPLFPSGRLCVELRLAELRKSSAVVEYERAIQTAFREVADGLAGRETFGRQIAAQGRTVASAERRADLSAQRYRAGVDGRLELLDAQGQLYAAKQALLDLRRGEFGNAVALYKALGGGLIDH